LYLCIYPYAYLSMSYSPYVVAAFSSPISLSSCLD